ncbi:MAG: trigger factor [Eubacteriales bacterium]|nr:trigger factor [Eubacteriales bacterium]
MKKKTALLLLTAGAAGLLAGCSQKSSVKDYSKYVTLGDYKNLTVERVVMTVTDEDVQTEIENELSYSADYAEVTDRAAQEGDIVTLDFIGTVDGEEFDGGSAEDYELELGSDTFIDGFEEQIVGMRTGDTKTISVTFPDSYDGILDGKDAEFEVTLKGISETVLPEYNDAYVASISDYSTTAEYEAALKKDLQETYDTDSLNMASENALYQLIEDSEYNGYPDDLYESCKEIVEEENAAFAEIFGIDDVSELYGDDYDEEAAITSYVNERMVVYTLASKEKLSVTDEEYNEALAQELLSSDYSSVDELKDDIDEEEYKYQLLYQKVLDFLAENCSFIDISEEEYYSDTELLDDESYEDLTEEDAETETETEFSTEDAEVFDLTDESEVETDITGESEENAEADNESKQDADAANESETETTEAK